MIAESVDEPASDYDPFTLMQATFSFNNPNQRSASVPNIKVDSLENFWKTSLIDNQNIQLVPLRSGLRHSLPRNVGSSLESTLTIEQLNERQSLPRNIGSTIERPALSDNTDTNFYKQKTNETLSMEL